MENYYAANNHGTQALKWFHTQDDAVRWSSEQLAAFVGGCRVPVYRVVYNGSGSVVWTSDAQ